VTGLPRFLNLNSIETRNIRLKTKIDHINLFVEECKIIEMEVIYG